MSYIEVTGKTEEEAIARALSQLGLDRDDVSVEIMERAKSGFLGIGATPAKVRVSYEGGQEPVVEAPAPKAVPQAAPKAAPQARPAAPEKKPAPQAAAVAPQPVLDGQEDEASQRIRAFLTGLLQQMDCPAALRITPQEKGRYQVIIEGDKLGQLIGRRGETLDAIQQLTGYAVNRGNDKGRIRVQVDAEGYRNKREQSLESLAKKVAGKAVKYRRSVTLEPMNAYERHVIHTALQEMEGVSTYSIGTEPNRRVVVAYDREKKGSK